MHLQPILNYSSICSASEQANFDFGLFLGSVRLSVERLLKFLETIFCEQENLSIFQK